MHTLVDFLTEFGNLRLADPRQPHRLHQIIDPARRHAADPGLLDHRDQRLLRALAGFQKRREIAAVPQLRDAQLQRSQAGVEGSVAITVAPGRALAAALVAPSADHPSTSFSISNCSTASATLRRKSPSPAFSSSSANTNLSSVIGSSRASGRSLATPP